MTAITTGEGSVIRIACADPRQDYLESSVDIDSTVAKVGSTGMLAIEPLVMVTRDGQTAFHTQCSPERFDGLISDSDRSTDTTVGNPDAVVDHNANTSQFPAPQLPGLRAGVRGVLGACGWRRPTNPDDHEAAEGFINPDPTTVLEMGTALRGRGWGDLCHDETLSKTWKAVRSTNGEVAVIVNAHGNTADALLLASAPFEVLDGASTVARIVGADQIIVYASADDERAVETVQEAVENHPDPPTPIEIVTGPADYRAAEPTMTLEAIEGNHRLEARVRPPSPAEVGLHGQPTLIHTPRTLAHLAVALREQEIQDTRVITVKGDVAAPTTVEIPESATLTATLDAVDVNGEFKAACVGGRFGGVTSDLDIGATPEALAGADMGTEGTVRVLTNDRCVVEFVGRQAQFAAEENCGRCVPCREGTTQLVDLLRDVYDGRYDPDTIEELVEVMTTSSICAFGVEAGRPARTALAEFETEFEVHADGQCPAGSCFQTLET